MSSRRAAAGAGSLFPWRRRGPDGQMRQVGWCAMLDMGERDGRRVRKTFYGKTQRQVRERLNEALRDSQRGVLPAAGSLTVGAFLEHWLNVVGPSLRPSTRASYAYIVEGHLVPALGAVRLSRLLPSDVDQLLAEKLAAGLSPRTVHHVRSALRTALRLAERDGLVGRNVAALSLPVSVEPHEQQVLDQAQVTAFLAAVKGERLAPLYITMLGLGLRLGEALGLRWSEVDLGASQLRVTKALQRQRTPGQRDREVSLVEPKSRSSRRTLPLPAPVLEALRAQRRAVAAEELQAHAWLNELGLVFVGPHGEPLNPTSTLRAFQRTLARAGLPRMRLHDLRHSCASLLFAAGVPVKVVSEVLGHSSVSLTQSTYVHLTAAMRGQATAAMSAALGGHV